MGGRASTAYLRSDRKIAKNTLKNWIGKNKTNQQIIELTKRFKHLKHQFRGIFPANLAFRTILKREKIYMIVNASN